MIILERDGSLLCTEPDNPISEVSQVYIDISATLLNSADQYKIIDHILNTAFNILGVHTLELRIQEDCIYEKHIS